MTIVTIGFMILISAMSHATENPSRYFHSGDGRIHLAGSKNGATFNGTYRNPDGTYDETAVKRIHDVFLAGYGNPLSAISMRLIEFLDFLEDRLNPGAKVTIVSGYRSPTYNTNLRKQGKLAAKASLHQYGMAADITIEGVNSEKIWHFVRDLGFGGVGYYHGANAHVDIGPARFWDENTSGVGTDISDDNKLIEIITDKDIYKPDELIDIRFVRATLFPIGVEGKFALEAKKKDGSWKTIEEFEPIFRTKSSGKCLALENIEQMLGIAWNLPKKLKPGRFRIRSSFCGEMPDSMPKSIVTPEFLVIK